MTPLRLELTQQLLGVRSAEVADPRVKQPTRPDGEREKSAERNPRIRAQDTPSLPLPPEIHRQSRQRGHLDDDGQHRQTHPGAGYRSKFHVTQPEALALPDLSVRDADHEKQARCEASAR